MFGRLMERLCAAEAEERGRYADGPRAPSMQASTPRYGSASVPAFPAVHERATSPGRALRDVGRQLQKLRPSAAEQSPRRGGVSSFTASAGGSGFCASPKSRACAGPAPVLPHEDAARLRTESRVPGIPPVRLVDAGEHSSSTAAADLQDIDARLLNLQNFLLAAKAPRL